MLRRGQWIVIAAIGVALMALGGARPSRGAEPKPQPPAVPMKAYAIADHGDLLVPVAEGWAEELQSPPPTLILTAADPQQCKATLTINGDPATDPQFTADKTIRAGVEQMAKQAAGSAEEDELPITSLKGATPGYYYMLTQKAPAPGELRHMTCGSVAVGDLVLSFTIRHRYRQLPELAQVLGMLRGAKQKPKPLLTSKDGVVSVPAMTRPWALQLPPGMKVTNDNSDLALRRRTVMARDDSTGLVLSMLMAGAPKLGGASDVRETWWPAAAAGLTNLQDLRRDSLGENALLEYKLVDNADESSKHMRLYIAHDGVWIDVHLSKSKFTDAQRKWFDEALRAIHVAQTSAKRE